MYEVLAAGLRDERDKMRRAFESARRDRDHFRAALERIAEQAGDPDSAALARAALRPHWQR